MKLSISKLKERDNPFQFQSHKDGWVREIIHRLRGRGFEVEGEIQIQMNITKLEPDYYMRGNLSLSLQQTCARCAELFSLPIQHAFDIALAHVTQVKARTNELADESDALDVNYFEGNEIDLSPMIEEQFFLSIPYQSVCKADCLGICQLCGRNLNHSMCTCKQSDKLNPFSVLAGVKL